jgi:hypothetical protein
VSAPPARVAAGGGGYAEVWYAAADAVALEVVTRGHGVSNRRRRAAVALDQIALRELITALQAQLEPRLGPVLTVLTFPGDQ